ncbi:MAG: FAD binding domain-containing protein, partial [Deltaproteobacteria bacterium]|nr:FAD binding domain-containing protein [Deltaproteobacteria bacterium]
MLGRLPSFDYYRPATLDETLTAMERLNGNFCVLAGGTDLLVGMKERRGRHPALLDIKALPELAGIRADNGTLCLGATVTTRAIAQSPLVRERFPMLFQSMKLLGSMQIGNRATIGGKASVKLVGKTKERWVPLDNFFIGPKKTIIEGELLAEVRIPTPSPGGRGIFYKLGPRNAPEDICIVSAAIYGVPDGGANGWKELRIALGAVAPTPIRARHAE